jgi:hypothetical protein
VQPAGALSGKRQTPRPCKLSGFAQESSQAVRLRKRPWLVSLTDGKNIHGKDEKNEIIPGKFPPFLRLLSMWRNILIPLRSIYDIS